jgi:hypothetical protein
MRRIVLSLLAAGGVAGGFAAQSAHADNICITVQTQGTSTGERTIERCQNYAHDVTCVDEDAGLDPRAHVYVTACVPG